MASQGRRAAGERGYELSAQYVEKQLRGAVRREWADTGLKLTLSVPGQLEDGGGPSRT